MSSSFLPPDPRDLNDPGKSEEHLAPSRPCQNSSGRCSGSDRRHWSPFSQEWPPLLPYWPSADVGLPRQRQNRSPARDWNHWKLFLGATRDHNRQGKPKAPGSFVPDNHSLCSQTAQASLSGLVRTRGRFPFSFLVMLDSYPLARSVVL